MKTNVVNAAGEVVGELELASAVFEADVNRGLMHQALLRQLANARLGTHKVKTRSEVRGGGRKPWRQKGTGRARQGTIRAPNWVGGGTVFGPTPRSYVQAMPKRMRRAAVRSALSARAAAGAIRIVDEFALSQAKTRAARDMLTALGIQDQRVLIVYAVRNEAAMRATRNLPQVTLLHYMYANVRDVMQCDVMLLSQDAVAGLESWLDEGAA